MAIKLGKRNIFSRLTTSPIRPKKFVTRMLHHLFALANLLVAAKVLEPGTCNVILTDRRIQKFAIILIHLKCNLAIEFTISNCEFYIKNFPVSSFFSIYHIPEFKKTDCFFLTIGDIFRPGRTNINHRRYFPSAS